MIFRTDDRTLTAHGHIWEGDGMEFIQILEGLEKKGGTITIKLHTYGGSVFDGNLMYNALRNSKADIRIEVIGIAASMGAVIALSREEVYIVENGFLMLHAPSGTSRGTAEIHLQTVKVLKSIESNFIEKLKSKTGQKKKYVQKWLSGDNWLDANEAMDEGLIAGVIDSEIDVEPFSPENLNSQEVYNRFEAGFVEQSPKGNFQSQTKSKPKTQSTMKKGIINSLGLTSVTNESSDTAVIEAVKSHYEREKDQLNAELTSTREKLKTLEDKAQAETDQAISALIDEAKKAGKITADQEETYKKIAASSGIDSLRTVINSIPARKSLSGNVRKPSTPGASAALRADWDFDKWQKEDPRGLEMMSTENPEEFKELYNQKFNQ